MSTLQDRKGNGIANKTSDECYTPENAIHPLLPFLKSYNNVWDCAFGSGAFSKTS